MSFRTHIFAGSALGLATLAMLGCRGNGMFTGGQQPPVYRVVTGGTAHQGRQYIVKYGCGKCHTIPGIGGAHGVVGPPLNAIAARSYIAGNFPNNPDMMVHWIMDPPAMKPATAMPDLNISELQARDIAAYLYTLR
ncbi:MAG TPA: c-type cytochrome [Acidobacteriaceae bacterium]|nr:c-type cytochrome [Acidobacteriaceae bacterium]